MSKPLALVSLTVVSSLNLSLAAFASYDSFLFGPDEKITTWSEPFDKAEIKGAESSTQTVLNQILVDQFLAQALIQQNDRAAAGLVESNFKLLTQLSNQRLLRSQILLKMLMLLRTNQLARARQEGQRLVLLSRIQNETVAKKSSKSRAQVQARKKKIKLPGTAGSAGLSDALLELAFNYARQGDLVRLGNMLDAVASLANENDRENLQKKISERVIAMRSADSFSEDKNEEISKAYDRRLAYARTLATLDRNREAMSQFDPVVERLKQQNKHDRPQTDEILNQFIRLVEINLGEIKLPRDNAELSDSRREEIVSALNSLIAAAYLSKLDGNFERAAHLFRRAYLINRDYCPDLDALLAGTCYDLAETLYWAGSYSEAEHYMYEALKLREKSGGENGAAALDTRSTLGRILIAASRGEVAQRFYVRTLQLLQPAQPAQPAPDLDLLAEPTLLAALIKANEVQLKATDEDGFRRLDDALQGLADAAISTKNYDVAIACDDSLLRLRLGRINGKDQTQMNESVKATLWQLAWVCQMASKTELSNQYYSRLIKEFDDGEPRPLADWYQARAINSDMLGNYKAASADFKLALKLFEKQKPLETSQEDIDTITWIIDDIKYNLGSRRNSPPSDKDYLKAEPIAFWKRERFPLKVFVETSSDNGFAGEIRQLMLKAMEQWTAYQDSPVTLQFVDKKDGADVYIERVISYDDIPFSSAGRTSVVYVPGSARDKRYKHLYPGAVVNGALDRAHVRVYCPSFDGNASGKADKIENQKMSSYARTHLYTLFMHEFGHVIGVGHSPCGTDVMYWKSSAPDLTERDKETIRKLYR